MVPIGLGLGRLGNFVNGELWGRVTNASLGMVFPSGGPLPRHPSQLYEAFFEGLVLFLVLWFYSRKPKPTGAISGLFLLGYGLFRFAMEFFREPDVQMGFFWGKLTAGQLLSLPMVFFGVIMLVWAYRGKFPRKKEGS
jgi:phosphatidylglycerol:prolipoprotein diacylglycerol transferase